MPVVRQIAAGAYRGGGPRKAKFTARDLPNNYEVHEPGSARYRGGRRAEKGVDEESRKILREHASRTNRENIDAGRLRGRPSASQMLGGTVIGTAAAIPLASAALIPKARSNHRKNAAAIRRKTAADVAKGAPKPKWVKGTHSIADDGLMRSPARTKDGAHTVTSMGDRTRYNPTRRARVRQTAGRAANFVARDETGGTPGSLWAGGTLAGVGVLQLGTRGPRKEVKDAQLERNRVLRAKRKAKRAQLVPVDKRFTPAHVKNALRNPSEMRRVIRENPWEAGIAAGGLGIGAAGGARSKEHRGRGAAGGAAGAAAGQAAYYGVGFGALERARQLKHRGQKQGHNGLSRAAQESIWRKHRKTHGHTQGAPLSLDMQRRLFESYPKELPGWRHQRLAAQMQRGKYGRLINAGATLGGAGIGASMAGRGSKQKVDKALYQREDRLSPVRTLQMAGGLTLAAYGLGHSGMVGRALGRGVKLAQARGNDQVADALARANAARGSIRAGMAPGEAALRRIKSVDNAIRKVPKPIRAEVALVAGTMMGASAVPVRRTNYRPVSAPVPTYGGWR